MQPWKDLGEYKDTTEQILHSMFLEDTGEHFMDSGGDRQGSGGSGGAYSYVSKDIEAGQKLKIVVGKGGQGGDELTFIGVSSTLVYCELRLNGVGTIATPFSTV